MLCVTFESCAMPYSPLTRRDGNGDLVVDDQKLQEMLLETSPDVVIMTLVSAVLCYAMLCCAMLCYAMLCYAILC
jgi:hypothetical protein